ncbi:MAG: hypothetical protein PHH93_14165 [Prolixibacteraceae bacterium]|nr:hypothetical protein [Prolixibacteraceae bacterium]
MLITKFGPHRDDEITYPDVFRANAFPGNYLRMDILSRYGLQDRLHGEIQDYFFYMADQTGTLWENMSPHASCNHGFASYLGHILYRDILGISQIDYINKKITVRFSDIDLAACEGSVPVDNDVIELNWQRSGKQINYSVKVPQGYEVIIENRSSSELVESIYQTKK